MNSAISQTSTPEGWRQVKLKDISSKIGSGVTPRGGSEVYQDGGVLFLRSQNVQNGYLNLKDVKYISEEIDSQMSNSRVIKNDVLYNITGASIGRCTIYTLDHPSNVNQHVCIVRIKNENPKFVNYLLNSELGTRQLESFQAGGNRQGLNYRQLGSYEFYLPFIDEQNRIVKVLETLDRAIDLLTKKIELKKQIKKGLMQELLTGTIRMPGFTENWIIARLGDMFDFQNGFAFKSEHFSDSTGIRLIRNRDLKSHEDIIFFNDSNVSKEYLVKNDDILIGMDGDFLTCRWTGGPALLNQRVGRLLNYKGADKHFMYYFTKKILAQIENETSSTTVKHLSGETLTKRIISIPSLIEQTNISNVLTAADKDIEILDKQLSLLKDQKKFLLNNLITGQIRTPESMVL